MPATKSKILLPDGYRFMTKSADGKWVSKHVDQPPQGVKVVPWGELDLKGGLYDETGVCVPW